MNFLKRAANRVGGPTNGCNYVLIPEVLIGVYQQVLCRTIVDRTILPISIFPFGTWHSSSGMRRTRKVRARARARVRVRVRVRIRTRICIIGLR